jgi:hypothetical protein
MCPFSHQFKDDFPPEKKALILHPEHFKPRVIQAHIDSASRGILVEGLGANLPPVFQRGQELAYPETEENWQKLFGHMNWLGLKILRYWLAGEAIIPEPGVFNKEHVYLKRLAKFNEWAATRQAHLILDFGIVPSWLGFPTPHGQSGMTAAPRDIDRYIHEFALPLVQYVLMELDLRQIKYLCLFNEPFNPDFAAFSFYTPEEIDPFCHYVELYARLRHALGEAGIDTDRLGLLGPNSHDLFVQPLKEMTRRNVNLIPYISAIDEHAYRIRLDYLPPAGHMPTLTIREALNLYLKPAVQNARQYGKPYLISEYSCFYYGGISGEITGPARHESLITEVEFIIRAIAEGISGALKWCLLNSGQEDGKWQYIETIDGSYKPIETTYSVNAVLCRYLPRGGEIHPLMLNGPGSEYLHGVAVVYQSELTVLLVNDHPGEMFNLMLNLAHFDKTDLDAYQTDTVKKHIKVPVTIKDRSAMMEIPPMSITALTSFKLTDQETGLVYIK